VSLHLNRDYQIDRTAVGMEGLWKTDQALMTSNLMGDEYPFISLP